MAERRCIIRNGVVENVVLLAEGSDWTPPDGTTLGPAGGEIGWTWNGSTYTNPNPPTDPEIPPPPPGPSGPWTMPRRSVRRKTLRTDPCLLPLPATARTW